ncbi:MAG: hypothetical protein ABI600_20485 [Luteolibacter sp.]
MPLSPIAQSGRVARDGVIHADVQILAEAVSIYHETQLAEGMDELPRIPGAIAHKYCGGGYGGYALYLFNEPADRENAITAMNDLRAVEPFCKV